ncbi:type IV secretion system DNA-binding domain-containing protein, partial [Modestobacter sp. KNN46-3]|uniref:type IV secretion system DNA-binding domain-containing protein n=1 Tax=Modestobacter sp. KNN46-3 TaxID=2711218 RepID=UPI0013E02D81
DDADFDPQSWLRTHWGWGTVYVVTTAGSEAKAVGPLVALMMSQIIEARRRTYSDEDAEMLLALDELAAAPVPGLSGFVSNDRAFGVHVLACTQTDEQVTENPVYGSSLLSGFGEKVIFPDSGSTRLHEQVENSTRKGAIWLGNVGEGSAQGGVGLALRAAQGGIGAIPAATQSSGMSQHEARVLDRAEVAGGIHRGQARFLTGYRALTRMVPTEQPDGSVGEEEVALPVRLLPPIDKPGVFKALTEWAENTHAWREYEATQAVDGEALSTQD